MRLRILRGLPGQGPGSADAQPATTREQSCPSRDKRRSVTHLLLREALGDPA